MDLLSSLPKTFIFSGLYRVLVQCLRFKPWGLGLSLRFRVQGFGVVVGVHVFRCLYPLENPETTPTWRFMGLSNYS